MVECPTWSFFITTLLLTAGKKPKGKSPSVADTPVPEVPSKRAKVAKGQPDQPASPEPAEAASEVSESDSDDDGGELAKVLKSLQFPDVETGGFSSSWCPKVIKCLTKRVTKLEAIKVNFPKDHPMTDVQSQYEPQTLVRAAQF